MKRCNLVNGWHASLTPACHPVWSVIEQYSCCIYISVCLSLRCHVTSSTTPHAERRRLTKLTHNAGSQNWLTVETAINLTKHKKFISWLWVFCFIDYDLQELTIKWRQLLRLTWNISIPTKHLPIIIQSCPVAYTWNWYTTNLLYQIAASAKQCF